MKRFLLAAGLALIALAQVHTAAQAHMGFGFTLGFYGGHRTCDPCCAGFFQGFGNGNPPLAPYYAGTGFGAPAAVGTDFGPNYYCANGHAYGYAPGFAPGYAAPHGYAAMPQLPAGTQMPAGTQPPAIAQQQPAAPPSGFTGGYPTMAYPGFVPQSGGYGYAGTPYYWPNR